MKKEVPGILRQLQSLKPNEVGKLDLKSLPFSGRIVNNQKVTDHHAIIPTGAAPGTLRDREQKVYEAIVVRLIAAFYPPCLKEVTTVDGVANDVPFRARGVRVVSPGWTELYPRKSAEQEGEDEQPLPDFSPGESGPHEPFIKQGQTTPPKHFTENTLLGAMDTAGKLVEEAELREALKEKGLGTPATRAAIIETLLKRQYVMREKKNLVATDLGRYLVALVRDHNLKSPELTGEWESKLNRIEAGQSCARHASCKRLSNTLARSFSPATKVRSTKKTRRLPTMWTAGHCRQTRLWLFGLARGLPVCTPAHLPRPRSGPEANSRAVAARCDQ